jgi:hypothetical protein
MEKADKTEEIATIVLHSEMASTSGVALSTQTMVKKSVVALLMTLGLLGDGGSSMVDSVGKSAGEEGLGGGRGNDWGKEKTRSDRRAQLLESG